MRMTTWNGKKYVLPQGPGSFRAIAERLAAYENTGLEPEEISELLGTRKNETKEDEQKMTENELKLQELFGSLVPENGKADSLAGEIVRAMTRIVYRAWNDGDKIGVGYGKETCNPPARFLMSNTTEEIANLIIAAWGMGNDGAYDAVINVVVGKVVEYVNAHPELKERPTEDMLSYVDPCEDRDDKWFDLLLDEQDAYDDEEDDLN